MKFNRPSKLSDVFRYKSLRGLSIRFGLISMATGLMYYGPTLIISRFGFDIYTSQTALNIADILNYFPMMVLIDKVYRRKCGMIQFGIATIISFALTFINKPIGCKTCVTAFIQLGLVFIFRFVMSMAFTLLLVYQMEVYPTRVRNTAIGVLAIFGNIPTIFGPIIMGTFTRA